MDGNVRGKPTGKPRGPPKHNSPMDKTLCDFCRYGKEVEDVCGQLHVKNIDGGKVIAAHRKCMQYSANLSQYKFEDFGGFKVKEVENELRRGTQLKCAICKKDPSRQKQQNRATSGCEFKSCSKSFHFYCAKKSDVCITKRMIARQRNSGKEFVMYRVFCCQKHEQLFRKNKQDAAPNFDSDSESEDWSDGGKSEDMLSNDGSGTTSSVEENQDMESDVDRGLEDIMFTSPRSRVNKEQKDKKIRENYSESDEDEVSDNKRSSPKSTDSGESSEESTQNLRSNKTNPPDDSGTGDEDEWNREENESSDSSDDLEDPYIHVISDEEPEMKITKSQGKIQAENKHTSERERKHGKDCKKSTGRTSGARRRENEREDTDPNKRSSKSDGDKLCPVFLVLIENPSCKQATKTELTKQLDTNFQVLFWPENGDVCKKLTRKHMPYLIRDVVNSLRKSDFNAVVKLLTDKHQLNSKLDQYSHTRQILNEMETGKGQFTQTLRKTLENSLEAINSMFEVDILQLLTATDDSKAVAVFIDKHIDPDSRLRLSLGVAEKLRYELYPWSSGMPPFANNSEPERKKESEALIGWITSTIGDKLDVVMYPNEPTCILLQEEDCSVSNLVASHLKFKSNPSTSGGEASRSTSLVVCICRMDTQIIKYKQFCLKFIQKCLETEHYSGRQIVFVVDIVDGEFKDVKQMIPPYRNWTEIYNIKFFTAVNSKPDQNVSSSLLIHMTPVKNQLRTKSPRKCTAITSPASTSNRNETSIRNKGGSLKKRLFSNMSPDSRTNPARCDGSQESGNLKKKRRN